MRDVIGKMETVTNANLVTMVISVKMSAQSTVIIILLQAVQQERLVRTVVLSVTAMRTPGVMLLLETVRLAVRRDGWGTHALFNKVSVYETWINK